MENAHHCKHEYDKVFPLDIFPEQLIKAIIAFDIDKMEELGIYEVAPGDFALCEFVDTCFRAIAHSTQGVGRLVPRNGVGHRALL